MSVVNHTPFPALAFRQYNLAGNMNGVVVVQGTFNLIEGGAMEPADDQLPLQMSDEFEGDSFSSSMIAQTALVPFKPSGDVTFVGSTFAPREKALKSWICAIGVGPVSKRLRVTGPRDWVPLIVRHKKGLLQKEIVEEIAGWKLTDPEPVTEVPIDWTLAACDLAQNLAPNPETAPNAQNPLGIGWISGQPRSKEARFAAPQIENPDEPLKTPDQKLAPEGFGYISPWWKTRLQFAGTYDDDWLKNRHPLLPQDFDFRFWQSAHPDLISKTWFRGDESYHLENLVYGCPDVRGTLPKIGLRMRLPRGDRFGLADFVLDGVHFDLRSGKAHAVLTWRTGFPWSDGKGMPEIAAYPLAAETA